MPPTAAEAAGLTLQEAADELGVHYMTAYRYVRTGRLNASQHNGTWRVSRAALDEFGATPTKSTRAPQRARVRTRLLERMTRGDEAGAWSAIEDVLAGGATPAQVIEEILLPVMRTIGERWAAGTLEIADEHIASAIVSRLVARLAPLSARPGRTKGTIVIGAAAGDHHALPSLFLSDLLRAEGFTVLDLGANTPVESFVQAAASADRLVSVAISMTAQGLDSVAIETTSALRGVVDVPLFVGGSAVRDAQHASDLGADAWAGSVRGAVALLTGDSSADGVPSA